MIDATDVVQLASELASIASATTDPATARRLMEIVEHMLAQAGLPPDEKGGGETPADWLSRPVYEAV